MNSYGIWRIFLGIPLNTLIFCSIPQDSVGFSPFLLDSLRLHGLPHILEDSFWILIFSRFYRILPESLRSSRNLAEFSRILSNGCRILIDYSSFSYILSDSNGFFRILSVFF